VAKCQLPSTDPLKAKLSLNLDSQVTCQRDCLRTL
jgi:hypothetical protein